MVSPDLYPDADTLVRRTKLFRKEDNRIKQRLEHMLTSPSKTLFRAPSRKSVFRTNSGKPDA